MFLKKKTRKKTHQIDEREVQENTRGEGIDPWRGVLNAPHQLPDHHAHVAQYPHAQHHLQGSAHCHAHVEQQGEVSCEYSESVWL